MDMFSYLLAKNKQDRKYDLTNIRNVINMTDADITSQTPFSDYPQDLYNGYINVLKDKYTLIDNMNKGTTTGETTDSANVPIYGGVLTKESTQETTTGKNLFNPALLSQVSDYNTYDSSTGMWTTSSSIYFDRSIFYDAIGATGVRDITKLVRLESGNYTIKIYDYINNTGATNGVDYALFDSEGNIISDIGTNDFVNLTLAATSYLDIRRHSGEGTFSFSKIMIISGTYTTETLPSYEPYTGKIPAPNPSYPQDIHVVTGDVDINVVGKNLFDETILNTLKNNEDIECYIFNNNRLYNQNLTPNITFKENTQYTIQYVGKQVSGSPRLSIKYTDGTLQDIETNSISTSLTKYTQISNANKTIDYITGNYGSNTTDGFYIKKDSVCLVEGTSTEYVPYQGGTYQISLGDNEICGIGDYKDELIIDKVGHCYINKKIIKYIFDGNENWASSQLGTNSWVNGELEGIIYDASKLQIISNIFRGIKADDRNIAGDNTIYTSANNQFMIRNTTLTSLSAVQEATKNNYIYYYNSIPTLIDLEQTVNIATCDGLTTITNNKNMDMSVIYIKNTYN